MFKNQNFVQYTVSTLFWCTVRFNFLVSDPCGVSQLFYVLLKYYAPKHYVW